MVQPHRGHPRGNSSDRASAKEERCRFSHERGVGVVALFWYVHIREVLR